MNRKWFVVAAALLFGTGLIAPLPGAGLQAARAADESIRVDWATAQAVHRRRGREVRVGLLTPVCAPIELAETEVAVGPLNRELPFEHGRGFRHSVQIGRQQENGESDQGHERYGHKENDDGARRGSARRSVLLGRLTLDNLLGCNVDTGAPKAATDARRQESRRVQNEGELRSDVDERGEERADQAEGRETKADNVDPQGAAEVLPNEPTRTPREGERFDKANEVVPV